MKRWILTLVCMLAVGFPLIVTLEMTGFAAEEEETEEEEDEAAPTPAAPEKPAEPAKEAPKAAEPEKAEKAPAEPAAPASSETAGENDLGAGGVSEEEVQEEETGAPVKSGMANRQGSGISTYWGDQEFNEVEKGVFFNLHTGYLLFLGDMANTSRGGFMIGAGFGYDFADLTNNIFSMEVDAIASIHDVNVYSGTGNLKKSDALANGDFVALRVPLVFNFKYFSLQRLDCNAALLGGIFYNKDAIDGFDAAGKKKAGKTMDYFGGLRTGVEYYTPLRHFSLAFNVEFNYIILNKSMGLSFGPSLKYTF